jgi:hypothetical protein
MVLRLNELTLTRISRIHADSVDVDTMNEVKSLLFVVLPLYCQI